MMIRNHRNTTIFVLLAAAVVCLAVSVFSAVMCFGDVTVGFVFFTLAFFGAAKYVSYASTLTASRHSG